MRLSTRTDIMAVVEKILRITGGDAISVSRKYKGGVHTELGVRLVLLTNSLPHITDDNKAFFSRFLIINLNTSFLGSEDPNLLMILKGEMSGIINWALDGYSDLVAEKAFSEPRSSKELRKEWFDNSNPIAQFDDECCTTENLPPDTFTASKDMFKAYLAWADENGLVKKLTSGQVTKNLVTLHEGKAKRGRLGKGRTPGVYGIKIIKDLSGLI